MSYNTMSTTSYAYAIGYGNELRSDDGIGQLVARALHLTYRRAAIA
ncbi:hypothetical protein H6G76_21290 [Nostoc sp. FACHB-152]|nr:MULTISPECIES: hypothetical protein [unclassified Nostoc]MBD2449656.1 hypothetical protein [Nostoc sp. FACHB-152]MBD2469680.1 hypothetical protein [Nostoc sp. FACHB-145]